MNKMKFIMFLLCMVLYCQSISVFAADDNSCSKWAEESISQAVDLKIVPENIQSKYTNKITRQEFCRLAVQTYITKTGNKIDMTVKTPFTDIDDAYITTAYNLKIVSGIGDDKFAPNNDITRQEAAVMLNNLAYVLGINTNTPKTEKFIDDDHFAVWAKNEIYSVTGIKSGDTFVMVGTELNKFSPWMNYTREQAIATMLRLYNCKTYTEIIDESDDGYIYFVKPSSHSETEMIEESLVKISNDGTEEYELTSGGSILIKKITDNYIYCIRGKFDNEEQVYKYGIFKIKKDGSEIKTILDYTKIYENVVVATYINENEIYYTYPETDNKNKEKPFTIKLVKEDLNGENKKIYEFYDLAGLNRIYAVKDEKVFFNACGFDNNYCCYMYNLKTKELKKATDTDINYWAFSTDVVSDGKYLYYPFPYNNDGHAQPTDALKLMKSDLNGNNEIHFSGITGSMQLYIYKGYIYALSDSDKANLGRNIIKINTYNGKKENITNYGRKGGYFEILKINNNKIYYIYSEASDTEKKIYCINIDGSDITEIYKY